MIRTFETHHIRKCRELSSSLWNFHTLPGEKEGRDMPVPVPGCWETFPETRHYRGRASYTRTFEAKGNIRLVFKGVSHTAQVFVDGRQAASHYNAYTPFSAVLTGLKAGTHHLQVLVDNAYGPESTLHFPNDYQTYGGITRGVVLEELGSCFISGMQFTPRMKDGVWHADISVGVALPVPQAFRGTLLLRILSGDKQIPVASLPVRAGAGGSREMQDLQFHDLVFRDVRSWSPSHPALYLLQAVLVDDSGREIDDLIERAGFREVSIRGRELLLNGEPFLIRGFCRHEDHPQFGCAIPFQTMYTDLMQMRDMGANAVRGVHYPNDELFLDLCDELGMFVWEEGHARALSEEQMKNPLFMKQSLAGIREMVESHYNHPSICIWGFLNECASDTQYGKECYQKHYDLIRSLDKSRPISFATCMKGTDVCLGIPDIVSYNLYPEWYENAPAKEYLAWLQNWVETETEGAGRPFLITEIGAGAVYGYRTEDQVKWSEEYQARALRNQLEAVLEAAGQGRCIGVFIWQFCDVRVSDEWFFSRPRSMNNKGITDEYRRPKLACSAVKELFHLVG